LKPENFIIVDKDEEKVQIKTIDFGLSKICHQHTQGTMERMNTKVGTPYYISPDVLTGNYDKSCDLWSAGCILYIMLCGYPPFNGSNDQEILKNVQSGKLIFDEDWDNISKEAIDLIRKLVCKPERRLSAQEALSHKWFKKYSVKKEKTVGTQNLKTFKNYQKN
jgi:calcium-dependent protein kinase